MPDYEELSRRYARPGAGDDQYGPDAQGEAKGKANGADELADGPLPLFPALPASEPYPTDALGPVLGPAADAIARKVQVPPALAAQSVLAAACLVAQAHADVLMPYGQARPLSLYLVTVAASGDRKTTADAEALWPIRTHERRLKEDHDSAVTFWEADKAAWAAEKKRIETANKKTGQASLREALLKLGPEPPRPLHPFLTAPDPTYEGLVKAWVTAPAALGVFSAEGGQFIGGYGMSQDNRLHTAGGLSELWDGQPIKRVRALDGVSVLPGRRLALHLMVQPEAAAKFLADPVLQDQGLLSRVLAAAPESLAGTRFHHEPDPADDATIRAYGARLLVLLEEPQPLKDGSRNELNPRELKMTGEAEAMWRQFHDHIERQCSAAGDFAPVKGFAAKIAEQAARIAGVLTVVGDHRATEISAEAMRSAVALANWYMTEAVRLNGAGRLDPKLLKAGQLLAWMQAQGKDEFGFRDLLQLGPNPLRTKVAMDGAVQVLMEHGWLVEVTKRPRRLRLVKES
jgi:hypothetical protein